MGLHGLLAAVLVIATNVILRPLVRVVNRQPIEMSEGRSSWHVDRSIECRPAQASGVRAQLVKESRYRAGAHFQPTGQRFFGEAGQVEVTATVTSHKRRELALEAIVGRFPRR